MRVPPSLAMLVPRVALPVLIVYVVFVGGSWHGTRATELRAANAILVAVGLLAWAFAAARRPEWRPASALMPGFVAALTAFAIGVALSRNPRLGIEYLAWSVLLVALYLFLVRLLASPALRSRVMGTIVVVTAVHGALYLVQTLVRWVEWWDLVGEFTTPPLRPGFGALLLGNPSAVMTVQVLLTVAAVGWLGWETGGRRWLNAVLIAEALVVTVISGSRSGWLAIVVALLLIGITWLAPRTGWVRAQLARPRARLAALTTASVAVLAAAAVAPGIVFRAAAGGEAYRLANYVGAWRMFLDEPVHGAGPGLWVAQRLRYTVPPEPDQYVPHAHNVPLQTLAEFGLVGALAGVVVAIVLVRLIIRAVRGSGVERRMAWAAALGTVYFGAHQLLDSYANAPAVLFAYAVPIAFIDAHGARRDPPRHLSGAGLVVAAVAVMLSLSLVLIVEGPAATMARATALADEGRWSAALPYATDGAGRDPGVPAHQFTLATVASHAGRWDLALPAYERAATADDFPPSWLGVAAGSAEKGDAASARAALERALRVGRQQPAILVAAADVYLRLGDEASAIDAFAEAIVLSPSLAGDRAWQTDERLRPLADQVMQTARASADGATAVDVALATGDVVAARAAAASMPAGSLELYMLLVRGWTGDEQATAQLLELATARPLDPSVVLVAARVEARQGRAQSAADLRTWLETLNGMASVSTYEVRFASPDADPRTVAGLASAFYGPHTYRRPTPADQIPGDLLQLELR